MPNRFKVRLPLRNSVDTNVANNTAFGLFDYLGNLPLYAATLYQMYRYSRIEAIDVEVQVNGFINPAAPTTAYGFDVAMGKIPFNEVVAANPDIIANTTGAVHSKGGQYGGLPVTVRKYFASQNVLGNPIYGEDAWQTYAQAFNTTPTNTNKPVVCVSVAPSPNIGTYAVSITWTVIYHVEFFDLDSTPNITKQSQPEQKSSLKKRVLDDSFESGAIIDEVAQPQLRHTAKTPLNPVSAPYAVKRT